MAEVRLSDDGNRALGEAQHFCQRANVASPVLHSPRGHTEQMPAVERVGLSFLGVESVALLTRTEPLPTP